MRPLVKTSGSEGLHLYVAIGPGPAQKDVWHFAKRLGLSTVRLYLQRWGFTPQRPVKRAVERQDAAIQAWLTAHYPKIAARAKAEGAQIHWGDETGISNQAVHGRSFAPKGQTPVLRRPATRRTLSMISAVTNRGTLRAANGARLDVSPLTNSGLVQADAGSTVVLPACCAVPAAST